MDDSLPPLRIKAPLALALATGSGKAAPSSGEPGGGSPTASRMVSVADPRLEPSG